MPIVNIVDQESPKNNRTIDTDTGVYLKFKKANGQDRIAVFEFIDGEINITFHAHFSIRIDDELKLTHVLYKIPIKNYGSWNSSSHNKNLVSNFLEVHGFKYRTDEKYGNKQVVQIEFDYQ